jgi:hypothetical protein
MAMYVLGWMLDLITIFVIIHPIVIFECELNVFNFYADMDYSQSFIYFFTAGLVWQHLCYIVAI